MRRNEHEQRDFGFSIDDLADDNFSIEKINSLTQNEKNIENNQKENIKPSQIIDYNSENIIEEENFNNKKGHIIELYGYLSNSKEPKIFAKIDWGKIQTYDIRKIYTDDDGEIQLGKGVSFNSNEIKYVKKAICVNNLFSINYQNPIIYQTTTQKLYIYKNILSFRYNDLSKQINISQWSKSRYFGNGLGLDFRKWSSNGKLLKGIFIKKDEEFEALKNCLEKYIEDPIAFGYGLDKFIDDSKSQDNSLSNSQKEIKNVIEDNSEFNIIDGVLTEYTGDDSFIKIPDTVTEIVAEVFQEKNNINSIYISENIRNIHAYAFDNCELLERIDVAEDNLYFKSINGLLFNKDLSKLIRVPINYSNNNFQLFLNTTILSDSSFYGCQFENIDLQDSKIKYIEDYAFGNCYKLNEIYFPESLLSIEENAFEDCENLEYVEIYNELDNLEYMLPAYCQINILSEINTSDFSVEDGVLTEYIGDDSFVNIPDNVVEIGDKVFGDNDIVEIYISEKVKDIHEFAFDNCKKLEIIKVAENNSFFTSLNGVLYSKDLSKLIRVPINYINKVDIPKITTVIANSAFSDCIINNINLRNTEIKVVEKYAFWNCTKLTDIMFPKSLETIAEDAFGNCNNLKYVEKYNSIDLKNRFPNECIINDLDFKIINGKLVGYSGDTDKICIPDNVVEINENVFSEDNDIKGFYISKNVINISEYLFDDFHFLEQIEVSEDNIYYTAIDGILYNKEITELVRVPINYIGKVKIPNSVTTIKASAFSLCKNIEKLNLNETQITVIEDYAFWGNRRISSINFPACLKVIEGNETFTECKNLNNVNIYDTTQYSECVFSDNCNIQIVSSKHKDFEIINGVLKSYKGDLSEIDIPDDVSEISDYALANTKNKITDINFGENIKYINDNVFSDCLSLESVTVSENNKHYSSQNGLLYNKKLNCNC